jgi:hypothetical protein
VSGTCKTFYRDSDVDGQGDPLTTTKLCGVNTPTPGGFVTNLNDCCDHDANVKLVAAGTGAFFPQAADPRCGAQFFDYDCNGIAEKQFPDPAACIFVDVDICDIGGTWTFPINPVPACGVQGTAGGFCASDGIGGCGVAENHLLVQSCR